MIVVISRLLTVAVFSRVAIAVGIVTNMIVIIIAVYMHITWYYRQLLLCKHFSIFASDGV